MSAVSQDAAAAAPANEAVPHGVSALRLRPRGWLMRRLLLIADVAGLLAAFALALVLASGASAASDAVDQRWELALFVISLPLWIVLMRIDGLYDRDEERTDHSTADAGSSTQISKWMTFGITSNDNALPQHTVAAAFRARHY